jgi:hypothetical protein
MFRNQDEYSQFRAWAIEGSCLAQRMFESVPGGKFDIPDYWEKYKKLMPLPDDLGELKASGIGNRLSSGTTRDFENGSHCETSHPLCRR